MTTKLDTKLDNGAWKEPFERHILCVSPAPSDIPWENMKKRIFAIFSLRDGVQRPFNQRFGQEANDAVRDILSSLQVDVDAHHDKAGWAANRWHIGVVRWSTEDVVCLFVFLKCVCMIILSVFPSEFMQVSRTIRKIHLVQKSKPHYVGDVSQQDIALQAAIMRKFVHLTRLIFGVPAVRWMRWWTRWRKPRKHGGAVQRRFQSAPICSVCSRCWCVRSL